MNIMVSVIIPAYNVAPYLDRCLKSVLCQSYSDFEIIVLNDGSDDDTEVVCRGWQKKDKRIRFISKNNEGQGPTRDMGIRMAKGKYIFFLDADDWIVDDCLEKLVKTAEETMADIVIFDYYLIRKSGTAAPADEPAPRYLYLESTGTTLSKHPELLSRCGGTVWNKLQRKEFIQKNNIHHPCHKYEDISYVYQMLVYAEVIVHLPELLYYYWIDRADSTTNKEPYISECFEALNEMQEIIDSYQCRDICIPHLMKYSAAYLQIPLLRVKADKVNEIERIYTEYYRRYPLAERVDQLRFVLIGSDKVQRVFRRMRFLNTKSEHYSLLEVLDGENGECYSSVLIGKMDCLLMDFEQLEAAEIVDRRKWEEKCVRLADMIRGIWKNGRGVFFLESNGLVKNKNGLMDELEKSFVSRLPEAYWLKGGKGNMEKRESIYWNYNQADELREFLLKRYGMKNDE